MRVAVVILNYNCINNTIKCIESFKKDTNNDYVFFIVDNNSNEKCDLSNYKLRTINENEIDTYEYEPKDRILFCKLGKNYGYSYGNNVGIKLAKKGGFKIAIIANPDTEIINISQINEIIEIDDNFFAIFPKVYDSYGNFQSIYFYKNYFTKLLGNILFPIDVIINRIRRKIVYIKSKNKKIIKIDFSIGCFIIINLQNDLEVDFFDSNMFLYNEEKVLYEKSKKYGRTNYYTDLVEIRHNHVYKEMSGFEISERKKSRVYYYNIYKHYSKIMIALLENTEEFRTKMYNILKKK